MNYFILWKHWIRPFAVVIYFILMLIAIPLCIIEVTRKDPANHVKAWFTGGVFVLLAVPISLWEILQHLIHYTEPHLQKYIIRILWMVPIYALNAWFALRFNDAAIYLDTIRECYEAYVIYNFMSYLLSYLHHEHPNLIEKLEEKPQIKHLIPFCCFPAWPMGRKLINNCKHGVLQYTIVRPVTTLIALFCEAFGKYEEGDFNFTTAWSYLVIVNNISQIWAMYNLVLFYQGTKEELKPLKPLPKFLCVKFVVFFSFWQAVVIAIFVKLGWIPQNGEWDFYKNVKEEATGIQDFCICIEMFVAAIAHYFSFSHKPFIRDEEDQADCCLSFRAMLDVSDVKDDVVEHVKVIGKKMKKTVSGPFIGNNTERTPLLISGGGSSSTSVSQTQQIVADVEPSYQKDTQSTFSDFDGTSIDSFANPIMAKSATASMNNYIDFSVSQDVEDDQTSDQISTDQKTGSHDNDEGPIKDDKQLDQSSLGKEMDSISETAEPESDVNSRPTEELVDSQTTSQDH